VVAGGGDDPGTTTVPTEGARLVAISDLTQVIRFGARTDMTVRYEQGDGSLVTGAILDWEVDGFAPEAVLAAGQSTTDGAGESTVGLTAGMVASTFIVRVTPPVGDALEFQIAITDEDSGSIRVDLAYTGTAAFDAFEAGLFEGMTCADLTDPGSLPTALIGSTVTSIRESPGFVPVAVGSTYMVAVQAKESGATTGFGCVDGISVTDQRETRVDVTISDVEILLIVEGVYEVTNLLDFGSGLPGSVRSTIDILDELTDDTDINGNVGTMDFGQDPGAFVVDFAMRQTCGWECLAGEDYDSCSVINHRQGDISALYIENFRSWSGAEAAFFGGCGAWEDAAIPAQNLVNTQVSMAIPDSITMFGVVAGDLARAINSAQFESRLTVDQPADGAATFIHELLDMTVTLHNLAGVESTYTFDVLDAGLASRPRSSDTMIMVTGNQVELPMHGFDINFGLLIRYIYVNGILPLLGYTSSAEMLNDWIDCDSIGTSLESSVGLLSAMEYADACRTGLTSAGTFLDVGLDGVIDLDGVMTLQGTATAGDPLPDGTATTLNGGIWMGGWSEDMGATSGDIDGTWTGTRRP
jgi:hypothetical protein